MDPNQGDDPNGQNPGVPQDDTGTQPTPMPEPTPVPDAMPGSVSEPGSGSEEPAVPPQPPITGDGGTPQGPDSDSNPAA